MNHVLRATCYVLLSFALASVIQAQDPQASPVTITLVRWPFT